MKRNENLLRVSGGGLSADAYHMTAPHPDGNGAKMVMENCLRMQN